ncbi:MAG TPA: type II toxin-antitoxin system VapC family toxin [Thermoanaerobaculia bacterium]|nr:type II toxin-antitoxin system VapC family toxin [Thermoanaerobaculia bacterium]
MILIDTNVFMYAAGKESLQRLACQRFLERLVGDEPPPACTDVEVLQEILHRYRTMGLPEVGFKLFDAVTHLGIPVLSVTDRSMAEARQLLEDHPALSTRDCVHLGVMREHGIGEVLSYDTGFSGIPWVNRSEA